ncbi:sulfate transport system permease protein [Fulvimarina manganoxydans]|uniref:Sulfate transport system permease protein CysT n=1 Tax=Fulvimarina manganoxydans TaxID=937218 RepID=A0A1W1YCF5_9HYPH|nr:sulfate ABC transporter permease subunit CysT [Fulvimarina manganoxydans]SMC33829.1 sulfate transport system permease protein [Fulvimarina manganoxydans]
MPILQTPLDALRRRRSPFPGFGLTLGVSVTFVTLIVLLPLAGLGWQLSQLGLSDYLAVMSDERTLAALRVTIGAAALATLVNGLFGLILAWVLVRYRFFGRSALDALVDLPFALPTSVAGIALVALYSKDGWIGSLIAPLGLQIAYSWWGIVIAMTFTSVPFAVRAIQPLIEELDPDEEAAAWTLGASRWQTFISIVLPKLSPGILTGTGLSFVRSLGEFGAVIFIAGNIPYQTEIASLLIMIRLDEFDYPAASAIAGTMLALSLVLLVLINVAQTRLYRRLEGGS